MDTVANSSIWKQVMSSPPQDRVRQQIAQEMAPTIVLALYRVMKGSRHARLEDISPEALATLTTEVLGDLLTPARIHGRIQRVNLLQAHGHALADDEQETVMRDARSDIARFGVLRPGFCYVCREQVFANRVTILITENLHTEGHGLCCAKDEQRFEVVGDEALVYRVKAVNRG